MSERGIIKVAKGISPTGLEQVIKRANREEGRLRTHQIPSGGLSRHEEDRGGKGSGASLRKRRYWPRRKDHTG